MNVWNFTGNIGKDCEVGATQGGTTVCKFTVAVKSGYGDNKKTTWVNCRLWGKRAEGKITEYLKKGQKVAISGECELAEWQGQDGSPNKALMVNVNDIELCGSTIAQQAGNAAPTARQQQPAAPHGAAQYQQNASAPNAAQSHSNNNGGFTFDDDLPPF
jgi:single-strand DNA-binding protein